MFMKLYQMVSPLLRKIFKRNGALCSDDFCSKNGYDHLAPRDDVDKDGKYCELLNWAISNKNIYNIALSGPYGSGKSSVLKTYEKNYKCHKCLNISLLSLLEDGADIKTAKIEEAILLQAFYSVKNTKIPFSRFNKIHHLSNGSLIFQAVSSLLFAASIVVLFFPNQLIEFNKILPVWESFGFSSSWLIF